MYPAFFCCYCKLEASASSGRAGLRFWALPRRFDPRSWPSFWAFCSWVFDPRSWILVLGVLFLDLVLGVRVLEGLGYLDTRPRSG